MVVNWEEIAPIYLPFNTHCFHVCERLLYRIYIMFELVLKHYT
jgi:hypothetical protein